MIYKLDDHIQSGAAFKDAYGHFNYKLCFNDGLLKLARNQKGELVQPEVRTQNDVMSPDKTTIIGQFDDKDQLNGVGRIACTGTEYDYYQEGQFVNHKLHGFGRELRFEKDGKQTAYIGWFKDGKYHGHGMKLGNMLRMKEGIWNENN